MKTTNEIQTQINSLQAEFGNNMYLGSPERKKAGRQIVVLRQYISYLQAGAQEKFLKRDLEILETTLDLINEGFGKWLSHNKEYDQLKNPQAKYDSEMGTLKVKRQIEALTYLLN